MVEREEEERTVFEIGVVVVGPKSHNAKPQEESVVEFLVKEFEKLGLVVETVLGVADQFIKVQLSINIAFIHMYKHL